MVKEKNRVELPDLNNNKSQARPNSSLSHQPRPTPTKLLQDQPNLYPNLRSTALRVFSILNILLFTGCTALEVSVMPSYGLGVWTSFFYMVNGFLGYSASYRATKPLLISVVTFSGIAVIIAVIASTLTALAQNSSLQCYAIGGRWFKWESCKHLQFSLESLSIIALCNNFVILILVFHCLYCSSLSVYKVTRMVPVSVRSTQSSDQSLMV